MSCKFHQDSCYDDNDLCPGKIQDRVDAIANHFNIGYQAQSYMLVSPKYLEALKKAAKNLNLNIKEVYLCADIYRCFGDLYPDKTYKKCYDELVRVYND